MMYRLVRLVFSRGNAGVRAGGMVVSAVIGAFTNTALVMGMIFLAFRQAYAAMNGVPVDAVLGIILGIVAGNGIPEAVVAAVITPAVALPLAQALHLDKTTPASSAGQPA